MILQVRYHQQTAAPTVFQMIPVTSNGKSSPHFSFSLHPTHQQDIQLGTTIQSKCDDLSSDSKETTPRSNRPHEFLMNPTTTPTKFTEFQTPNVIDLPPSSAGLERENKSKRSTFMDECSNPQSCTVQVANDILQSGNSEAEVIQSSKTEVKETMTTTHKRQQSSQLELTHSVSSTESQTYEVTTFRLYISIYTKGEI